MGVNVLLFLVFQIGVEPWRRKRLVKGFEEKVMEALEKEGGSVTAVVGPALVDESMTRASPIPITVETQTASTPSEVQSSSEPAAAVTVSNGERSFGLFEHNELTPPQSTFTTLKLSFHSFFSTNHVSIRHLDLTIIALESFVTGAALVSFFFIISKTR